MPSFCGIVEYSDFASMDTSKVCSGLSIISVDVVVTGWKEVLLIYPLGNYLTGIALHCAMQFFIRSETTLNIVAENWEGPSSLGEK